MRNFLHVWMRHAILCYALIAPLFSFAFHINGPTTVCPRGTYVYTAINSPSGTNYYDWDLSYTSDFSIIATSGRSSNPISISFNTVVTGAAYIRVNAVDTDQPFPPTILGTTYLTVYRSLPAPVTPNGGTVLFCGANETVAVNSSPYIPFNTSNPSDVASCLFHCTYTWQAPGGWNFASGTNSPSNSVRLGGTQNDLQAPGVYQTVTTVS
jgi:hypothetical protein